MPSSQRTRWLKAPRQSAVAQSNPSWYTQVLPARNSSELAPIPNTANPVATISSRPTGASPRIEHRSRHASATEKPMATTNAPTIDRPVSLPSNRSVATNSGIRARDGTIGW